MTADAVLLSIWIIYCVLQGIEIYMLRSLRKILAADREILHSAIEKVDDEHAEKTMRSVGSIPMPNEGLIPQTGYTVNIPDRSTTLVRRCGICGSGVDVRMHATPGRRPSLVCLSCIHGGKL